jgi:hypothetical protein
MSYNSQPITLDLRHQCIAESSVACQRIEKQTERLVAHTVELMMTSDRL